MRYLSQKYLITSVGIGIALPVDVPVAQVSQEPRPVQFRHVQHQPLNVQPLNFGAVLFVAPPFQTLLVGLADFPLGRQALLGHPGTEDALYEAEQLLHVGFHLAVRHLGREVRVGAHLEQQVVAEVHRLVTTSFGAEGGLVRARSAPAHARLATFLGTTGVGLDHFPNPACRSSLTSLTFRFHKIFPNMRILNISII